MFSMHPEILESQACKDVWDSQPMFSIHPEILESQACKDVGDSQPMFYVMHSNSLYKHLFHNKIPCFVSPI